MKIICKLLPCVACLVLLANNAYAEDSDINSDSGVDRGPMYHVFADVDLIPTTSLEYDRPRIVIKMIVPKLVTATEDEGIDAYNSDVLDLIDEENTAFRESVKNLSAYQQSLAKSDIKNELIIDFDTSVLNAAESPIISLRFDIHGYISGMTSAYRKHRVLNYDLNTGTPIELSDLFNADANYLQVIADTARNMLERKLKDKTRIADGTAPNAENFKNWNLSPSGLRITFDQGQVSANIQGSQTITIPYAVLEEMIAPESILADCLKHRRRCFSNPVLTGGFIDEAALSHEKQKPATRTKKTNVDLVALGGKKLNNL